jgi:hypothetical protein
MLRNFTKLALLAAVSTWLLFAPLNAQAVIAVSQIKAAASGVNSTPGAAPTFSFTTLPTTGHSVLVELDFSLSGGSNVTISSIADNQGVSNTYTLVKSAFSGFGGSTFLYWCPSIGTTSGTFTITVNITSSTNSNGWNWAIMEASGLAGTVDQTGSNTGNPVTTLTATAAGANATANELVIGGMIMGNFNNSPALSNPPTTGYTTWFIDQSTINGQTGAGAGYKIVSAGETSAATWSWTGSGHASALVATFQGSGGGGGAIQQRNLSLLGIGN